MKKVITKIQKLALQIKQLKKDNKALTDFNKIAAHQLKSPLRAISGFANFLEVDCKDNLDDKVKEYLAEIKKATDKSQKLIDSLFYLTKCTNIKNVCASTDINDLLRAVIERLQFDISTNRAVLDIQNNMPVINCNSTKISEVFFNLISNAIKFSSKNHQVIPQINVGYLPLKNYHQFYVKDNGVGIAPVYHKKIFAAFTQVCSDLKYEGVGLGLTIARNFVIEHHGKIWVKSQLGKGATFYFTIPK